MDQFYEKEKLTTKMGTHSTTELQTYDLPIILEMAVIGE